MSMLKFPNKIAYYAKHKITFEFESMNYSQLHLQNKQFKKQHIK